MLIRPCIYTLALLAACGFPRPADVGGDDFTVTLGATRVHVVEGGSVTVDVKLSRASFSDPITVTVTGLPAGVTAAPLSIDEETGTLTLRATADAMQGDAALIVTAMGTKHSHDVPLSLLTMGLPGTLDQSFGSGGMLAIPLAARGDAIAIQSDGRIIVAGSVITTNGTNYMVTRYLSNGEPDTSFSEGIEVLDPYLATSASVALQPDGKIIVVETSGHRSTSGILLRLNPSNGSRDTPSGRLDRRSSS